MNELKLLLSQTPVGVLAVTETWLQENATDTIYIQGYHFVNISRNENSRGCGSFCSWLM